VYYAAVATADEAYKVVTRSISPHRPNQAPVCRSSRTFPGRPSEVEGSAGVDEPERDERRCPDGISQSLNGGGGYADGAPDANLGQTVHAVGVEPLVAST
jgi:hypothetical protein